MTCKCHNNEPTAKSPTTQCAACAYKHYVQALAAYNEYGYSDDNRDFIAGELRMIVLHSFRMRPETAKMAREASLAISEGRWSEADWPKLKKYIRNDYDNEYPGIRKQCDKLKEVETK